MLILGCGAHRSCLLSLLLSAPWASRDDLCLCVHGDDHGVTYASPPWDGRPAPRSARVRSHARRSSASRATSIAYLYPHPRHARAAARLIQAERHPACSYDARNLHSSLTGPFARDADVHGPCYITPGWMRRRIPQALLWRERTTHQWRSNLGSARMEIQVLVSTHVPSQARARSTIQPPVRC